MKVENQDCIEAFEKELRTIDAIRDGGGKGGQEGIDLSVLRD